MAQVDKIKQQITGLGVTLVVAGVMTAAVLLGAAYVQRVRQEVRGEQLLVDTEAQRRQQVSQLRESLEAHDDGLNRIRSLVLTPERMPEVISSIEKSAQAYDVTVAIPTVKEAEGQEGEVVPVEMNVEASGDPAQLVRFLHIIEHLPYMADVLSWNIQFDSLAVRKLSGSRLVAPEAEKPIAPQAKLNVVLTLTVRHDVE